MAAMHAGNVPALVRHLAHGSRQAKELAACALRRIVFSETSTHRCNSAICQSIAVGGGIPALVSLLDCPDQATIDAACSLLADLTQGSAANIAAIAAADAIPLLIQLLRRCGGGGSDYMLSDVAAVLANLVRRCHDCHKCHQIRTSSICRCAPSRRLAQLYSSMRQIAPPILPHHACPALCRYFLQACNHPARRRAITSAGGIPPLLLLLRRRASPHVFRTAAHALHNVLHECPEACHAAVVAGGAPTLAHALCNSQIEEARREAGAALIAIADAGPGHHSADACFTCLVCEAIMAAGGIHALVELVSNGSEALQAAAAGNLYLLTHSSPERCQAIAAAGGIPALEGMLRQHLDEQGRNVAALCLRKLSSVDGLAAPPRVCGADGCTATRGLRCCAACRSVRFCSTACQHASWKEHKPLCLRRRAAADAATEASAQQQP